MYNAIELVASGARVASGSQVIRNKQLQFADRATILLDVTAAANAVGDTLDVYVQKAVSKTEDGSTIVYQDIAHFTQVLGNGGAKQYLAQVLADAVTTAQGAPQDAAIAAGVSNGPWSDTWRVKWVVVNNTAPSFTFSVYAHLQGSGA